jgi:superfamily I DNA/RNA helicase
VAWRRAQGAPPGWTKLRARLLDHVLDVRRLFADEPTWRAALPPALHRDAAAAHAHNVENEAAGVLDFEDAALVLRLGQLKAALDPELGCPWARMFRHIVIDEAQDLSTHEIEAVVGAADEARSVTIAGDPAQKILADAQVEGFEALLARLSGRMEASLDVLSVGYRSPRPVMELAMKALGTNEPARAARDGAPVAWFEGEGAAPAAIAALRDWRAAHPRSLVAVLSKRKNAADEWAAALVAAGLSDVRRGNRGDFGFEPGIVVSNVHQVKGLEFDGVLLIEPSDFGGYDRHLLHVAITRAAERLWVVAARGRGLLA